MEVLGSILAAGWAAASFGGAKLLSNRYNIHPWIPLGFALFLGVPLLALLMFS